MKHWKQIITIVLAVMMSISGTAAAFAAAQLTVEDSDIMASAEDTQTGEAKTQVSISEDCIGQRVPVGESAHLDLIITHPELDGEERIEIYWATREVATMVITNDTPSPTTWSVDVDNPWVDEDPENDVIVVNRSPVLFVYVDYRNDSGEWEFSYKLECPIRSIPNLSEVSNAKTGVRLGFWRLVSGLTTYDYQLVNVYRKAPGESEWTLIGNQQMPVHRPGEELLRYWTDSDVENGKMYTYSIKTVDPDTLTLSDRSFSKKYYYLNQPQGLKAKNSSSGKTMTISWNRNNKATGYEIQYATNESMKNAKTRTVSGYKNNSLKLKNRTPNKQYWIQVRSYKTVNGVKYYSAWSDVATRYETDE